LKRHDPYTELEAELIRQGPLGALLEVGELGVLVVMLGWKMPAGHVTETG